MVNEIKSSGDSVADNKVTEAVYEFCYRMLKKEVIVLLLCGIVSFMRYCNGSNLPKYKGDIFDVFRMDDYSECEKDTKKWFCAANLRLVPHNPKSKFWKDIEDWAQTPTHYNRSVIHRKLCLPKEYDNEHNMGFYVKKKVTEELKEYNVSIKILSIECKTENKPFDYFDNSFLICMVVYFVFIVFATTYEYRIGSESEKKTLAQFVLAFSLKSNWRNATGEKNPDFSKLRCIQGIRTYNTVILISLHTMLSTAQLNIKNTEHVEELYENIFIYYFVMLSMYVVSTYFIISSWLLTNHIMELYKKNGRFSLRDGFILFVNRVVRFWPSILIMIFIIKNFQTKYINGPMTFELSNSIEATCSKNWWATVFQVTNVIELSQVCNAGMWSLSIDTQFYLTTIVLLYLVINYQWDIKALLGILMALTVLYNATVIYENDLGPIWWAQLDETKRMNFFNKHMEIQYASFYSNWGASLTGIFFGYLYFNSKNSPKIYNYEKLFLPLFVILPTSAVLIGSQECGRWGAALLGPLLKPFFSLGIGVGILGMSRNVIRGWTKSICECNLAVSLGNFTFSTYIFHFLIVFSKGAYSTTLIEMGIPLMIKTVPLDVILSLFFGIIFTMIIEQPTVNLKQMILPQIRKKNVKEINGVEGDDTNKIK